MPRNVCCRAEKGQQVYEMAGDDATAQHHYFDSERDDELELRMVKAGHEYCIAA
jgi:hypothetical protein